MCLIDWDTAGQEQRIEEIQRNKVDDDLKFVSASLSQKREI